jgi:hypothetical protein
MIARNLSVAMFEAIRQHAETFHGGKMDVNRTLSAIGDLASDLLADIREPSERGAHYCALINGIGDATCRKVARNDEVLTKQ